MPYLPRSLQGVLLARSKGYLILRGASRLDAFSVYPCRTWLPCHGVGLQQVHQRSVHPGPLVLRTAPLRYPAPTPDRDRTVSRRSEPSSRTALMGGQPNPWNRIQLQDAMSRHRGAKQPRRYGLLGVISLLSPAYLLSVERWPFHAGPPDHYDRLSSLLGLSTLQSSRLMPLHSKNWFPSSPSLLLRASVTLWEATAPVKLPTIQCPNSSVKNLVRFQK